MSGLAVVFDLDDTLYPERQFALSGFRAAGCWAKATLGIDGLAPEMERLLDEGHLGRLFGLALAALKPDHTPEHLQGLIAAYQSHTPEIALHDDAEFALRNSGGLGPLGLITDGTHRVQAGKVGALGLGGRFREIIYTDALGPGRAYFKPHVRAFEEMQRRLGGGRRLVYVGDNPAKDFVAPNALGWITVQVVRPGGIHAGAATAEGGAPQHLVGSLRELPDVLGT